LRSAGHEVALVLTQPDRPMGRGLRTSASAVKRYAIEARLPVYQPSSLKSEEAADAVRAVRGDAMVVAAYGMILPQRLLDACSFGALNIHASLLPRWRGAAPIQRAILAGDPQTGISIMKMDRGLDTGPVLLQRSIRIDPDDDAGTLHDKLAALGAQLIVQALEGLGRGALEERPQPDEGVTYATKIARPDTILDWTRPAIELERAVRAFRPTPGATTQFQGEPLKIWRASVQEGRAQPGQVTIEGQALLAGCGDGQLRIEEVQKAGGKRMPADQFLRGTRFEPGARLG
jgi:methionyl-tRNA formyltransferase